MIHSRRKQRLVAQRDVSQQQKAGSEAERGLQTQILWDGKPASQGVSEPIQHQPQQHQNLIKSSIMQSEESCSFKSYINLKHMNLIDGSSVSQTQKNKSTSKKLLPTSLGIAFRFRKQKKVMWYVSALI